MLASADVKPCSQTPVSTDRHETLPAAKVEGKKKGFSLTPPASLLFTCPSEEIL